MGPLLERILGPTARRLSGSIKTAPFVYNDTLVESPVFQSYVLRALQQITDGIERLGLPIDVSITKPPSDESFWVNLLGKGYPAPNRNFRWCMDRLKIRPSSEFIAQKAREFGEVVLVLGVRRAESAARQQRIDAYSIANDHDRLIPSTEIDNCFIYRPIKDLSTSQVWEYLREVPSPWGSNATLSMLEVYQDAGMCNATQSCALMDETGVADSSSILARFGCWTCTVVKRDRSLESLIDSGYPELQSLVDYRNRLRDVSDTPKFRSKVRRNGAPGLGPLTFEARAMLLSELLNLQDKVGLELISPLEVHLIREQWEVDKSAAAIRSVL
ncbi:MAG: phosphoadenosine phosphosulfate reductase family protein, partial [Candidatus Hydrogenedentes bacterium]|nr:phosphoadenosine phosphosulfate reductase family protein [Candidatus Hydrogenedentota bacterium]